MKFLIATLALGLVLSGTAAMAHCGSDHSQDIRLASNHGGGTTASPATATARPASLCDQPGVVSLAGEVILRIHAPAGGKDCQERANIVQMRIVDALSIGLVYPKDVIVKQQRGEWAVFVRDILIITADAYSARVNNTSPKRLAEIWQKNLQRTIPESTPQKPM